MALSNFELEYISLSKVTAKAIWLRRLLQDLGFCETDFLAIAWPN